MGIRTGRAHDMNQLQQPDNPFAARVPVMSPQMQAQMQAQNPEPDDDGSGDLRALLALIWRGKWIVATCALIATVLALLVVSQFEPKYTASAKVMFDIQKANVVDLQQVLVDQEFSKDTLQNQIEILQSSNLIALVIADLGLTGDPEFNARIRTEEPGLWDRITGPFAMPPEIGDLMMDWGLKSAPPPPLDATEAARRELQDVTEALRAGLGLRPVRGSRVIEVSYTSRAPRTAARVVNSMADQYIVNQLEAKLEAARAATAWLSSRVSSLKTRVEDAEAAVEAARTRLSLEAGQGLEITNQQLEALNGALALARNNVSRVTAQYERLTNAVDTGLDLGAIPEFRDSALIQSFRASETSLLANETALRASVRGGHPALVRLQAQITETRRNIEAEASRIIAAIQIELDGFIAQEQGLIRDVRELETKALTQSANQVELRQLEREAGASRTLYETLLNRQQETSAQEDLQNADARVLSPAEIPMRPDAARKRQIVVIAALLGMVMGVGIVVLLNRLNNTFRAPQQIEEMTGLGVLATIPGAGARMTRSAVVAALRDKPNGSLAESVRNLRTSILFSNVDAPPRVVMFTSSTPREGKSTTSMMMAMTSRQMGKSAIIVDCDLRMPALAKLLGAQGDQPGLLSVMDGTASIAEALYQDDETGLHVLMSNDAERPVNINAADILASQRFRDVVDELSAQYDLVILDTPPALVVTDARIVAQAADAVVYALRWDHTPRGAVLEGLREMKSVDAPVIGIVLTMVNEAKAARYAYDGYVHYRGRYRDYYEV